MVNRKRKEQKMPHRWQRKWILGENTNSLKTLTNLIQHYLISNILLQFMHFDFFVERNAYTYILNFKENFIFKL